MNQYLDVAVTSLPALILLIFWLASMRFYVKRSRSYQAQCLEIMIDNNRLMKEQAEALKEIAAAAKVKS